MARTDWVALVTDPAAEYTARLELERFDLHPYLPQIKKRWLPPRHQSAFLRRYPLFPRYLLLPIRESSFSGLRLCRGLCKVRPILCTDDGRLWRAPDSVIAAGRESEERGDFDEVLAQGDRVRLVKGVLAGVAATLTSTARSGRVEVLMPLFGGVRATAAAGNVARL